MNGEQPQNIQSIVTIALPKSEYDALLSQNANYVTEIEYLKHELDKLRRMIFGARSERFVPVIVPGQLSLGLEMEVLAPPAPETETITYTRKKQNQSEVVGHGRLPLPSHLPRVEHIIEPEEDTTGAKKIGEEITEVLEYMPGKLYVNKYIRPKYALPEEKGIVIGMLPSFPIPRGNAGPGLLAHLIISKYVDHLPFYRQSQMFKRQDIHLAESTLNGWFSASCELMQPLNERLRTLVQKSSYLMVDETPIPVLTRDKPGATHKGYLWVYYAPLERMVLFDYQKGRGRDGPTKFLENYQGILQTDGYEVYSTFEKEGITLLACMAHARRKFYEALKNDKERSEYMLGRMQKLYSVEQEARDNGLSPDDRKALRQEKSLPVLQEMEQWLKAQLLVTLPKSAIGKAIAYTLNLWPRLIRYINDGRCEIDNNLVENAIRPVAIGRKNYLFAGSHEGAARAALIYSFMGSCKQNNVEPFHWLEDTLTRLPDCKMSQLNELLPQRNYQRIDNNPNIPIF